jgi:hypothetical protein
LALRAPHDVPILAGTTKEADVISLFDRGIAPIDGMATPDLVVHNAGNHHRIDIRKVTAPQFEGLLRVGCFGGLRIDGKAARRLIPIGRDVVIFAGASARLRGKPGSTQLAAVRASLGMVVQSRARAYGSHDLTSYACPLTLVGAHYARSCRERATFRYRNRHTLTGLRSRSPD